MVDVSIPVSVTTFLTQKQMASQISVVDCSCFDVSGTNLIIFFIVIIVTEA